MKLIVTDLTRFNNKDIVCTAGIEVKTGRCVRPMPYFPYSECKRRNVHPGMIVEGDFSAVHRTPPHVEDMNCDFKTLKFIGPATSDEFENVLKMTLSASVSEGFDDLIPLGQKVIPTLTPPNKSIITIKLKPDQIQVVDDAYNPEKIKLHIHDNDDRDYTYVAISDLGFHHFAVAQQRDVNRETRLNTFIGNQKRVYLRIGLSREYAVGSRRGFWIQANGIYTFPDYLSKVRTYP